MRNGIRLAGLATRKVLPEAAQPGRCAANPMVVEQLRISDLPVLAGAALSQRLSHLVRVLLHRQAKSSFKTMIYRSLNFFERAGRNHG